MFKGIVSITIIFVCTTIAWFFLSSTMSKRTSNQHTNMHRAVGKLWGTVQRQKMPSAFFQTRKKKIISKVVYGSKIQEEQTEDITHDLPITASDINVDLALEHRKKGLLWYATYRVKFNATYHIPNAALADEEGFFVFPFPARGVVYDNFKLFINGHEMQNIEMSKGAIKQKYRSEKGKTSIVEVIYESQGLDEWWYDFGDCVNQIRNFSLTINTDFDGFDFHEQSISPTSKSLSGKGWTLKWQYQNLLTGVKIGLEMPKKLNPGPWAAKVTSAAPVSLFLFFFLVFMIVNLKGVKLHPMNYFFLAAAFFSFHLLLAYLVDHISIHLSFIVCSLISHFQML